MFFLTQTAAVTWRGVGFISSFLFLVSCVSSGPHKREFIPELDLANKAPGAAYTSESMHFRKEMPLHKDWRPVEFYFKSCEEGGDKPYYSKTSYECTYP